MLLRMNLCLMQIMEFSLIARDLIGSAQIICLVVKSQSMQFLVLFMTIGKRDLTFARIYSFSASH